MPVSYTHLYDLYSDYENIQTTKGEANCESLFESNYVYDANHVTGIMSNMIWVYVHWRGDMLAFNEPTQIYSHGGWGFFNPTKAVSYTHLWLCSAGTLWNRTMVVQLV